MILYIYKYRSCRRTRIRYFIASSVIPEIYTFLPEYILQHAITNIGFAGSLTIPPK